MATNTSITAQAGTDSRAHVEHASRRRDRFLRILPLVLLAYAVLLPTEIRVDLAGQTVFTYRAVALVLLPWIISRQVAGTLRYQMADALAFLGSAWIMIAMTVAFLPAEGFLRGAAIVLDILVPYLIGRYAIRDFADFRRFLVWFAPGIALAALSMMAETIARVPLVRPAMAQIFGAVPIFYGGEAVAESTYNSTYRMGMLRAAGPFSHPILAGLFLASLLSLYFKSGIRGWPKAVGLGSSLTAILSWSSAAILGLAVVIPLMIYDRLQKVVVFINWHILLAALGVATLAAHLASQNGIVSVLVRFTLDPQTGYFRLLTWEYGIETVKEHPIFGIGYTAYDRPDWMSASVDTQWLALAMRHGLIAAIALFALACLAIADTSRASARHKEPDRSVLVGVAISLAMMTLMGFTVAFFGGILVWYFALVGAAISLAQIRPLPVQS